MKGRALAVILVATVALLVAALAPTGGAAAQPQPTVVISPASGPCDAPVQVNGSGFDRSRLVMEGPGPALYLLRPGADDISMGILNPVFIDQGGAFSEPVGLYEHGCEAAALDSQAERPTGRLSIALSAGGPTVELGGQIPNIIAIAEYTYTTTTPPPRPTMVVSPPSGACDATVEVTGSAFQPGQEVSLGLKPPGFDVPLGTLATAVADARGQFVVVLTLGDLGCRAAQICITSLYPTEPQLQIVADPIPPPQQIGASLGFVVYTFTTTEVSRGEAARALPNTGAGPGDASALLSWVSVAAVLAGVGLIMVVGSLYRSRRLRS
jgi:hypothetical protein